MRIKQVIKDFFYGKCIWHDTGDYYHFTTKCGANYRRMLVPCGGRSLKKERCSVCGRKIYVIHTENNDRY